MNIPARSAWPAVLVTGALLASGCRQDPVAAARTFVANAESHASAGRHKEAIIEYRNALQHQPKDAAIHLKLARTYERAGDTGKALASYRQVTRYDATQVDAHVKVARALLQARRPDEAQRLAARAVAADPSNIDALTVEAAALNDMKQPQQAHKRVREALALNPRAADALLVLGAIEADRGNVDASRQALRSAIDSDPGGTDALLALAAIEWAGGKLKEAEALLVRAAASPQAGAHVRRRLAAFYQRTGKLDESEQQLRTIAGAATGDRLALVDLLIVRGRATDALEELEPLLASADWGPHGYLRRAMIHAGHGRDADALADLDRAAGDSATEAEARLLRAQLRMRSSSERAAALTDVTRVAALRPRAPEPAYLAGTIHLANGNLDEAERWFKRARDIGPGIEAAALQLERVAKWRSEPDNPGVLMDIAMLKHSAGDVAAARDAYAKTLARDPKAAIAANNLAWIKADEGRIGEALTLAEQAHAALADQPQVIDTLGWMQHLAGQGEAAVRTLTRARDKAPANPLYHFHLGMAYARLGRATEARQALTRALALSATFEGAETARETLGKL